MGYTLKQTPDGGRTKQVRQLRDVAEVIFFIGTAILMVGLGIFLMVPVLMAIPLGM